MIHTRSSVLGSMARRLMLATALAGAIHGSGSAVAGTSDDGVYSLSVDGSNCGGTASCNLANPTSVLLWDTLQFSTPSSYAAIQLMGNGTAMTTNVVDVSLPGVLSKTDTGSDRTSISAVLATYTTLTGSTPTVDLPLGDLITIAADGSFAKRDLLKASSAWNAAETALSGASPASMGTASWISSQSVSTLMLMAQPELRALALNGDQVDAAAAQVAVGKILYRTLTDADLAARDGDFLNALNAADADHDGYISLATAVATAFGNAPLSAERQASLLRLQALIADSSKTDSNGDLVYRVTDIVRAAEADGSANDRVYRIGYDQQTGQPIYSTATSVSVYQLLRWYGPNDGAIFNVNATAMYQSAFLGYLEGSVASSPELQTSLAKDLMASSSLPLPSSGGVTVANGAGISAQNAGAITLTSDVAITAAGTSIDGLSAYGTSANGNVSVTNRGTIDVTGSDVAGMKGKVSSGSATVTVTNEGAVTVIGLASAGVRAKSTDAGDALVINTATGTVDVAGGGSNGLSIGAWNGSAEIRNAGTVTVHDGAVIGILAYTDFGAHASVTNTGTVLVTGSAASGTKAGAIVAAGGAAAAEIVNSGTVTVTGNNVPGLLAITTATTGTASATNSGTVTITGDGAAAIHASTSGAGAATATNSGLITVTGLGGVGIVTFSSAGAASADNTAAGRIDVTGLGSNGINVSSGSAAATATNAGTVNVKDGFLGVVAYSDTAAATATNLGTIALDTDGSLQSQTIDGSGTLVVGALAAGTAGGTAKAENKGTLSLRGRDANGILVAAEGPAASATAINSGTVTAEGANLTAIHAEAAGGAVGVTNTGTLSLTGTGENVGIFAVADSGDVTVSNGGTITTSGEEGGAIYVVTAGAGKIDATNSAGGRLTATSGTNPYGLYAYNDGGTGAVSATNAGEISATGRGAGGLIAMADLGDATATNTGRITVTNGDMALAAWSYAGKALAENAGTVSISTDASLSGNEHGAAIGVATGSGSAVLNNTGTATATGTGTAALYAEAFGESGSVSITNGAAATASASGTSAAAVVALSGAGSIAITNLGTIEASGTDAIAVYADSIVGTVDVDNSGRIAGSVSLAGSVVTMKNAGTVTGTVTLEGDVNTFTLSSGGSVGRVVALGADNLLQVTEVSGKTRSLDAANFVGFQQANLSGAGNWLVSGDFSGTGFAIGGGRAQLDGDLGSVTLSGSDTILMGTGRVADLTVRDATLAPGDTHTAVGLGTITVGGDLTLSKASTVLVDVVKDTSDQIDVKGTAHLAGTLLLRGVDVVGGKTITVLTAGAIDQTFTTTTWTEPGKWDFLKTEVIYGQTSVTLKTLDPVSSAKETLQPESKTFLDNVFGETPVLTTTEQQTAYQTIGNLISDAQGDVGKIQKTMDEVSGKATVVAADAGTVAVQAVDQAVSRATDAALGGGGGGASGGGMTMGYFEDPADADPGQRAIGRVLYEKVPRADTRSLIAWSTGQFGFGSATNGTSHSDFRSGGVTIGLIKRIDEAFSIGFAGGYTRSNISVENPSAHLGVDSYHLLMHGTWDTAAFRLNGLVGYAVQHFDGSRSVAGGSAASAYGGGSVRFGVDGGYKIKLAAHELMPFVGLDVIHGWTAGYTETGAPGGLNLTVADSTSDTIDGRIGLKWSTRQTVAPGVILEPMLSAAWIHSFGDATPKVHASMLGNSFVMTGASRSREALAMSAGLTTEIGGNMSVFGRYSGRMASDMSAHDFAAGLRYRW